MSKIIYMFVQTLFKVMQKESNKTTGKAKKYGEPYERRSFLRRGDIRLIQKTTGLAYISVIQQLDGTRKITPPVKAMADKLANNNQALIEAIDKININHE